MAGMPYCSFGKEAYMHYVAKLLLGNVIGQKRPTQETGKNGSYGYKQYRIVPIQTKKSWISLRHEDSATMKPLKKILGNLKGERLTRSVNETII